jgi:hypothetical protein
MTKTNADGDREPSRSLWWSMESYNIQPVPLGQPISIGPALGAEYATFSPFGQSAYIVPEGTLGAKPVIPWGQLPPGVQQAPMVPPGAYDYLHPTASQQWQPSVPVRSPQTQYSSPQQDSYRLAYQSSSSHTYVSPTAAERDAANAADSRNFGGGFLALLGAFVYCAPPWWIIATHNPTAPAMSAGGVLQALVGLWAFTTFIVGPIGIVCFFGGVANLFKPKRVRR